MTKYNEAIGNTLIPYIIKNGEVLHHFANWVCFFKVGAIKLCEFNFHRALFKFRMYRWDLRFIKVHLKRTMVANVLARSLLEESSKALFQVNARPLETGSIR